MSLLMVVFWLGSDGSLGLVFLVWFRVWMRSRMWFGSGVCRVDILPFGM